MSMDRVVTLHSARKFKFRQGTLHFAGEGCIGPGKFATAWRTLQRARQTAARAPLRARPSLAVCFGPHPIRGGAMNETDVRQSRLYSEDLAPVPAAGRK